MGLLTGVHEEWLYLREVFDRTPVVASDFLVDAEIPNWPERFIVTSDDLLLEVAKGYGDQAQQDSIVTIAITQRADSWRLAMWPHMREMELSPRNFAATISLVIRRTSGEPLGHTSSGQMSNQFVPQRGSPLVYQPGSAGYPSEDDVPCHTTCGEALAFQLVQQPPHAGHTHFSRSPIKSHGSGDALLPRGLAVDRGGQPHFRVWEPVIRNDAAGVST
jgi:hypothetical protein